MSRIEEPLQKGWLGKVMRDAKNEVAKWPASWSYSSPGTTEACNDKSSNDLSTSPPNEK